MNLGEFIKTMENANTKNIDINELTIEEFRNFVEDKVFCIDFIKKTNGKKRRMNARIEVSKDIKGTRPEATAKRKETLEKQNMVTVYDMVKGGYRTIWLDTVVRLAAKGKVLLTSNVELLSAEDKAEILMD